MFFLCWFLFTPLYATIEVTETSPRFIVHLLDYIAMDYPGAVKNGKVLNAALFNLIQENRFPFPQENNFEEDVFFKDAAHGFLIGLALTRVVGGDLFDIL